MCKSNNKFAITRPDFEIIYTQPKLLHNIHTILLSFQPRKEKYFLTLRLSTSVDNFLHLYNITLIYNTIGDK